MVGKGRGSSFSCLDHDAMEAALAPFVLNG